MKAGFRHGDNAAMAVIEFVDRDTSAKGAGDRARVEAEGAERGSRSGISFAFSVKRVQKGPAGPFVRSGSGREHCGGFVYDYELMSLPRE